MLAFFPADDGLIKATKLNKAIPIPTNDRFSVESTGFTRIAVHSSGSLTPCKG